MSIPPLAVVLISDGTNTDAAERGNRGVGSRYVREREKMQHPRFCHQAKELWRGRSKACWSGPCRFHHLFSPIRHHFPDWRAVNWSAAGTAHGNLTPPRISPSCPHCVKLWLGRSTIVRGQDYCEAACQSCFWMDGYRSSPYWAVFIQKQYLPHRWSSRILRIAVPFLAHPLDVISVAGYVLFKLHEAD